MYRIREVKTFKHIIQLNDRIFPGEPYDIHPSGYYWVVFKDKRPVGFAGMHILTRTKEYETVFFSRAGILKTHRGQGLGQKLLRVRLNLARKLEMKTVITYTIENIPSANNLIKAGFRLYEPDYKYAGRDATYWRKDIC